MHLARDLGPKMALAMERQQRRPWRSALVHPATQTALVNEIDVNELFDKYDMYYRGWMLVRSWESVRAPSSWP